MSGGIWDHGYGSHRRESLARTCHRNRVSEGCGCGEPVLGLTNGPRDPLGLAPVAAWLADRLWRARSRVKNADGPAK